MTPAVRILQKSGTPHAVYQYELNDDETSYGEAVARALDLDPARVFKTLLAETPARELVVAIVPVTGQLDLKALAAHLGVKSAAMAQPAAAERATGYVVGGISPLGQRKALRTLLDASALEFDTIYVSGGKRGVEIELSPLDLLALIDGTAAPIARASDS